MKRSYIYILSCIFAAFAAVSCEELRIDEMVESAPLIEAFVPESAAVGEEIVVTGKYLHNVVEAYIGEAKVEISEKVSDSRLSIIVSEDAVSGKIALVNVKGRGESEKSFSRRYVVPELTLSMMPAKADLGEEILIGGLHLNAVKKVLFTSGQNDPHEGAIITRNDRELTVKVPWVESDEAAVSFLYSDGSADVQTDASLSPTISVVKPVPVFNPQVFDTTAVGRSITLTGENLGNVERITVGEVDAPLFHSPDGLSFTVPAGEFKDGNTTVELRAWYFEGNESQVLASEFTVFVPFVKFWQNVVLWTQGRVENSTYACFFSPEDGIVYANADWATRLDPIAMKYFNTQWGSGNMPKPKVVSDDDYYSVKPYFFISAVSGNVLQLNSPANSNSQLKNFFKSSASGDDNRITGANSNCPGTPILSFRVLDAANATEKALIDKVLADDIEIINEELFPIDAEAGTVAGIKFSSAAGGLKSDKFCDHQTATLVNNPGYKLDAVFLVAYYDNCGYDSAARAAGIRRLGLLHLKQIDWGVNGSNYSGSSVVLDCYWQKYDYDYSKLQ